MRSLKDLFEDSMKYFIGVLAIVVLCIVGCTSMSTPYKITTESTFKHAVQATYREHLNVTYCVFANADVILQKYTFIGLAPSNDCKLVTLKVSTTCDITPEESLEANKAFGTLFIKQCGPNTFKIYGKESNMTKGYNYEI